MHNKFVLMLILLPSLLLLLFLNTNCITTTMSSSSALFVHAYQLPILHRNNCNDVNRRIGTLCRRITSSSTTTTKMISPSIKSYRYNDPISRHYNTIRSSMLIQSSSLSSCKGGITRIRFLNHYHRHYYSNQYSQQQDRLYASTTTTPLLSSSTEYGIDMDQNELMESDQLIAVDENDQLLISSIENQVSKRIGHTFNTNTPRGVLHRAFSLFVFNERNELLLTKRASTKITFPNVWTNTVCSHPLHGMNNEVDDVSTDYPTFNGIKHAAIRKLKHELGYDINAHPISINDIQFVTRYHYWASDTITYGTNSPWGEHEIDYLLFLRINDINNNWIKPNPDEVSDFKFINIQDLKSMYNNDKEQLLWSPWFIGILENSGYKYWNDMENTLLGYNTNKDITYFDPPKEHMASYNLPSHSRTTGVLSTTTTTTTGDI